MAFKNLDKIIKIISYIERNPRCLTSDIKSYLNIKSFNPPTAEEQDLYHLIRLLAKNDYLKKEPVINKRPGGPHFTLSLSEGSEGLMNSIRSLYAIDGREGSSVKRRAFDLHDEVQDIGEKVEEILDDLFLELFEEVKLNLTEIPNLRPKLQQIKSKTIESIIDIL